MNIHLNAEQRKMVEENLSVIQKVISKHVMLNESVDGMGYDDICQIGSIGLCKAAVTYRSGSDASFQTYAFSVVRNEIYNHLRSIVNKQKAKLTDIAEEQALVSSEQTPEERIADQAALDALRLSKERYQGVAKCGIEALELKLKGYSGAEIAKMYQVKPNYIAACICRAVKYLKKDKAFFVDLGK